MADLSEYSSSVENPQALRIKYSPELTASSICMRTTERTRLRIRLWSGSMNRAYLLYTR